MQEGVSAARARVAQLQAMQARNKKDAVIAKQVWAFSPTMHMVLRVPIAHDAELTDPAVSPSTHMQTPGDWITREVVRSHQQQTSIIRMQTRNRKDAVVAKKFRAFS